MSKHWIGRLAELTVKARESDDPLTSREKRTLRKLTAQMAARTGRVADSRMWRRRGNQVRRKKTPRELAEQKAYNAWWSREGQLWPMRPEDYRVEFYNRPME